MEKGEGKTYGKKGKEKLMGKRGRKNSWEKGVGKPYGKMTKELRSSNSPYTSINLIPNDSKSNYPNRPPPPTLHMPGISQKQKYCIIGHFRKPYRDSLHL